MQIINDIPFALDETRLMEHLHIDAGSEDAAEFQDMAETVAGIARPKAGYVEAFIEDRHDDRVRVGSVVFESRMLRLQLDSVHKLYAFVATCGHEVDAELPPDGDFVKEFWRDTLKASLLAAAVQHLTEHLEETYRLPQTASMSPGSGDAAVWPIEQQRNLFDLLGDVEGGLGVRLTESFLMVPNKTISGVRYATTKDFRTCEVCRRPDCPSRSAPFNADLWASIDHT